MRPSEKGHVPLQAGMYLTDGYRIDPKMERDYLNHALDNQGWLGRPATAVSVAAANQIDFERCWFEHLGSTGLDYEEAVQGGVVRGCLFRDIAGTDWWSAVSLRLPMKHICLTTLPTFGKYVRINKSVIATLPKWVMKIGDVLPSLRGM